MSTRRKLGITTALAVACSALFGVIGCKPKAQNPLNEEVSIWTNDSGTIKSLQSDTNEFSILFLTNSLDEATNFLTLENRAWVQMVGVAIVRVTDDEWKLVTNYFREHVTTNPVIFYGK